ncbi:zinc finger protein 638 isoform X2 [Dermochelys coriacea]|uniref:zinc finger protein 638 isoform X2 n=2 Tax=Dermochelys coriacea TaxID=27794 RepID=UPI001CAA32AC|nr:zinc finger protein 638 isoform X2 [Dermochelys coriacea]
MGESGLVSATETLHALNATAPRAADFGGERAGFVLFLESFAPLVNSLNLGIVSPLLLGPPPLQLAQIKTQLAQQQLTSAASNNSTPPYALLNQAFLKIAMFSPRGNLHQRPRAPNPSGSKPPGAFRGGGIAGLQRKPAPGTPQGISQRFGGHENLQRTGSRRTNVQVTQHRTDPRQAKEMANLQEEQKEKVRTSRWDNNPCPTGNTSRKHPASTRITEQNTNVQSRYTTESASSILASFGLSNEDLEELSRYPDDQLTPENMPLILRDIRMRKMGHQLPNLHSQSREKETVGGTGGSTVKSKVIDYGHTSRYGYTEDPLEVHVYNPEEPAEENRKEFQPQQTISVPPSNVTCNPMFPVEELMKQMGFHSDSSNTQSFFPVDAAGKVPGLCMTPTGLPMVKPMSQPGMPPLMPPMSQTGMPPLMPPLSQPGMPPMMPPVMPPMPQSVMTPIVQQSLTQPPMAQPVMPPISHPPFSAELLAAVRHHERIQHESGTNQSNAQIGSGQKNFQTQVEAPIKSPFGIVKASWLPVFSQAAAQKVKRLPTPSMMNDYYATSPRIFPHMCSLCNMECTHMKDWIQHQNNPAHIESCRQLRQQYPDWNPEVHSSKRNEGERKENQTPKRRSNSASPGPRHSRGSGSGHMLRRSRSRSRSPGRFRLARPRSRSPRQMRRPSPRHRSRSPQRSRNPLRCSPRPQRSASNEWASRRTTRSPDKKAALEAVVKSLGASFVAEFNKQKSLQATGQGSSGIGKASPAQGISGVGKMHGPMKKPLSATGHHKTLKKDLLSVPGSAASKMKSETAGVQEKKEMNFDGKVAKETNAPRPAPYNRLLREKLLSCGTVLHISDLPDDGFSDQDIKKIVQPFGKVSDLLVLRSRNEAFLEMNYKEAVIAAVKYGETVPVLVNGKRVKISVAEKPKAPSGQVKVSLKKAPQNVKKAALSTKKDGNSTITTKKTKSATPAASAGKLTKAGHTATKAVKLAGKHEVTKKLAVQTDSKTKKTSTTSAKPNEKKRIDPKKSAESKKKDAKPKKVTEPKRAVETKTTESKQAVEARKTTEPKKAGDDEAKEISKPVAVQESITLTSTLEVESNQSMESIANKENLEAKNTVEVKTDESTKKENASKATGETTKSEEPTEPASKELDDICVVLISNLPDKGYSVEEVSNLTKPFGGLKDVLILSSHKKAYLEINQKSADSMVKFYTCFPMSVDGNQLCISMAPEYKNIKDEEAIFTAMIKDANSKVNTDTLYNQFVHLGNLPDDGYTELEVVCVGLRFGKVDHYVVLKNKKKAILQLDSPDSAKSMCCFLKQYPYNMGENTLTCMLSPRREPAETEVMKKELKNQEPSKGSSDLKKNPEGSGVVQTAAANPPVEPSVAKEEIISSSVKAETSTVQIEASELEPERTVRDSATKPSEVETSKGESEVAVTGSATKPADDELSKVKSEEILLPPFNLQKEEVVKDNSETELLESAITTVTEGETKVKPEELPVPASGSSEELSSVGKLEDVQSDSAVKPTTMETAEAVSEVVPPDSAAASVEMLSAEDIQSSNTLDTPVKNAVTDTVETKLEIPVANVVVSIEKKPEKLVAKVGPALEKKLEKSVAKIGTAMEKKLEKPVASIGTDTEKKPEKPLASVGTDIENTEEKVLNEKNERTLIKAHQNKGPGQVKIDEISKASTSAAAFVSIKEPTSVSKTILKAVVSIPDISKSRVMMRRNETSLTKIEEQKVSSKPETRSRSATEKKLPSKEVGQPRATGSRSSLPDSITKSKLDISPVVVKGGSGRSSSQQDKDSRVDSRGSSKQFQERESRSSSMKKDDNGNKVPAGRISRNTKTGSGGNVKPKEEEELFPFNLDEFVTVDEVVEETDSPLQTRRNPPRGKRKDSAKNNSSSEPIAKRKKGKSSIAHVAESELSFVTLDEIGEEEEMTAQLVGDSNLEAITDPQGLVTVDEVNEEEELISEAVKDPQSLVTLDEISEQEDFSSHDVPKDVSSSVYEEQDLLKAEPLVTVDEIGEVEELPLNEPSDLNIEETLKPKEEDDKGAIEDPGDFISSQLPEDPSTLVTVDEIQEDSDDQPLVTLDEVTEDDEDFLADFNRLKEELNFVTVDEVGEEDEEEEENSFIGTNLEEEDIVAIAGPEEMEILADIGPEEEAGIANSKSEEKETLEADTKEMENETLVADTQEADKEALGANTEEIEKPDIWNKTSEKEIKGETESEQQSAELSLSKAHESNEMGRQTKNKQQPPVKTPGKRGRPRKRPIVPPPETPVETEQEKCDKNTEEEADKSEVVEGSTSESSKEKMGKGTLTTPESNSLNEDSQTATFKEPDTESVLPDLNASLLPDANIKQEVCREMPSQSSEKTVKDEFGSGDTEPESKRRKVDSSADKSKTQSTPKGLDFLVPKAGYFCQICSLFYAGEMSMKNHCKTLRHQQNMEKFMAKQKDGNDEEDDEGEELSSR